MLQDESRQFGDEWSSARIAQRGVSPCRSLTSNSTLSLESRGSSLTESSVQTPNSIAARSPATRAVNLENICPSVPLNVSTPAEYAPESEQIQIPPVAISVVSKGKSWNCKVCGETLALKRDYNRHLKKHEGPILLCGCCQRSNIKFEGYREDKIKNHMVNKHGLSKNKKPYRCGDDQCHRIRFASFDCLKLHEQEHHQKLEELPSGRELCDKCRLLPYVDLAKKRNHDNSCEPAMKRLKQKSTSSSLASEANIDTTNARQIFDDLFQTDFTNESTSFFELHSTSSPNHREILQDLEDVTNQEIYFSYYKSPSNFTEDETESPTLLLDSCGSSDFGVVQSLGRPLIQPLQFPKPNKRSQVGYRQIMGLELSTIAVIQACDVFRSIDARLRSNLALHWASLKCISYNTKSRVLTLRGNPFALSEAEKQVLDSAHEIYKPSSPQHQQREAKTNSSNSLTGSIANSRSHSRMNGTQDNQKIFALSKRNHPEALQDWISCLMPALSDILPPRIGENFSVSMVLRGQTVNNAEPWIQIESPNEWSSDTKTVVTKELQQYCLDNECSFYPLIFSIGQVIELAGITTAEEIMNSDYRGNDLRYSYNKPWQSPGMGASLGVRCSSNVSGTLGGMITLDGRQNNMLTSSHFIQEAWKHASNSEIEDRKTVVSPALCDLEDDVLQYLEQCRRDNEASLEIAARKQFDSGNEGSRRALASSDNGSEINPFDLDAEITRATKQIGHYLKEYKQAKYPQSIGKVSHQHRSGYRKSECYDRLYRPSGRKNWKVRMDWAVCELDGTIGPNRHRYASNKEAIEAAQFSLASEHEMGPACLRIEDPTPSALVYYVGRTSGRRTGRLCDTPMLVHENGIKQVAWVILETGLVDAKSARGDSGAWIIQNEDDVAIGQLWGASKDGKLLFSPLTDIVQDIKEDMGIVEIDLPPPVEGFEHLSATVSLESQLTCYSRAPQDQTAEVQSGDSKLSRAESGNSLSSLGSAKTHSSLWPTPSLEPSTPASSALEVSGEAALAMDDFCLDMPSTPVSQKKLHALRPRKASRTDCFRTFLGKLNGSVEKLSPGQATEIVEEDGQRNLVRGLDSD